MSYSNRILAAYAAIALAAVVPVTADDSDTGETTTREAQKCAMVKKATKRLACYDALFIETFAADQEVERPDRAVSTPEDNFGVQTRVEDREPQSIESTLTSFKVGRSGGASLTLSNGQTWTTREKIPSFVLKKGAIVVIKRGVLNSYRMTLNGKNRAYRVKRFVAK